MSKDKIMILLSLLLFGCLKIKIEKGENDMTTSYKLDIIPLFLYIYIYIYIYIEIKINSIIYFFS